MKELSESAEDENIDTAWLDSICNRCMELFNLVDENLRVAEDKQESNVIYQEPVTLSRSKKRGRPKKNITREVIEDALSSGRRISQSALAKVLGVHRHTLRAKIKEYGLSIPSYSDVGDEELDEIIRAYRIQHPDAGRGYMLGHLRSKYRLRIQRQRIIESMKRVDSLGQSMRSTVSRKKKHPTYSVPRPNALWHIDGHHKLIQWGIVIHGVADGYTRKATGMRASNNNRSDTVLKMYTEALLKHGIPSRARGDRGGENRDVSILMILLRGINRASFMWGSSVFNTRIERLWVEVGKRFVRSWRAFFTRLERLHLLKRKNPTHRWLLHYLFLDAINADCDAFCEEWNDHPISGPAGRGYSPNDLALMGALANGSYDDDCLGLTVEEINEFYGFGPSGEPQTQDVNTDDVHNSDSDDLAMSESDTSFSDNDEESSTVDEEPSDIQTDAEGNAFSIADVIDSNIRHDAVPVPAALCPFTAEQLALFEQGMELLQASNDLPDGYGMKPDEWDTSGYPTTEVISIGIQRRSKGKRRASPTPSVSSNETPSDNEDAGSSSSSPPPAKRLRSSTSSASHSAGKGPGITAVAALLNHSKRETNQGLKGKARWTTRSSSGSSATTRPKSKSGSKKAYDSKAKQVPNSSTLRPVYVTQHPVSVTEDDLIAMSRHDLCLSEKMGFQFSKDDTYSELDRRFAKLFPLVFKYLEEEGHDFRAEGLSRWLICRRAARSKGVIVCSSDGHLPYGEDVIDATQIGKAKTNFNEGILFLVSREAIPLVKVQKSGIGAMQKFHEIEKELSDDSGEEEPEQGSESRAEEPATLPLTQAGPSCSSGRALRSSSGRLSLASGATSGTSLAGAADVISVSSDDDLGVQNGAPESSGSSAIHVDGYLRTAESTEVPQLDEDSDNYWLNSEF
ncbi:hypothetical protein D9613_001244 [Agrocybe pediades]|uniref:Integrase catalytic domain-containing protein n=1 Tax=Agrocybe pediades TaxID=84607 RepID=A0A8H4VV57_9AGAR|nr:hypothetical protein D9613_001244 [Agrocybe pediades]